MSKPTGKLASACETLAEIELRIEALLAENDSLRGLYKMRQQSETLEMLDLRAERDAISQITEIRCEGCGYMAHHREHMGCVRAAKSGGPSLRELRMLDALEYALPYLEACIPNPRNGVNHDGSLDVNAVQRAHDAIASCRAALQGDQL